MWSEAACTLGGGGSLKGNTSPGRQSHSDTTLYISLAILYTTYTGWC
jgi:hypothetical protein